MRPLWAGVGCCFILTACLDFKAASDAFCQEDRCVISGPSETDTVITVSPGGTSGASPEFHFIATGPATFECLLEPAETAFSGCVSPKAYAALSVIDPPGYLFKVRAKDLSGAIDPTPAEHRFQVVPGPTVIITSPTNGSTVGASVTLNFNAEQAVTYTCRLDANPAISDCASGRVFAGLTTGTHSLTLTGTDAQSRSTSHTVSFNADSTGPGVAVAGAPAAGSTVNTTSASLTFTPVPSNEPAPFAFQCQLDSAASFLPCTGFSIDGLLEGPHVLRVRATDRFGNVGPVATHSWTLTPLPTTIASIRTTPVAAGTRVSLTGAALRFTARTSDRFWVQEGLADNGGITVRPRSFSAADPNLFAGRSLTVVGTVAQVGFNTTLVDASYTVGTVQAAYAPRNSSRDSLNVLLEVNEGMLVRTAGRASTTAEPSCQSHDFCIVSCERSTPVVNSLDGVISGELVLGEDHNFEGIVEGVAAASYRYYVTLAEEQNDACL